MRSNCRAARGGPAPSARYRLRGRFRFQLGLARLGREDGDCFPDCHWITVG